MTSEYDQEVKSGDRFEFGKNWSRFLKLLNEERINEAEKSMKEMLGRDDINGLTFLDVGSGSGLFSMVARRMGAKVVSFDYDRNSVACTLEMRRRFFPNDTGWKVEEGSVLDGMYLQSLGKFDIVYSWGVLHHTGKMWEAIANAAGMVKPGGILYIAIYNDQGVKSRVWTLLKRIYNKLPGLLRIIYATLMFVVVNLLNFIKYCLLLKPMTPIRAWRNHIRKRGMSPYIDWIDWIGGYPFEVATPEAIIAFAQIRHLDLLTLKRTTTLGCNEYVFVKKE